MTIQPQGRKLRLFALVYIEIGDMTAGVLLPEIGTCFDNSDWGAHTHKKLQMSVKTAEAVFFPCELAFDFVFMDPLSAFYQIGECSACFAFLLYYSNFYAL